MTSSPASNAFVCELLTLDTRVQSGAVEAGDRAAAGATDRRDGARRRSVVEHWLATKPDHFVVKPENLADSSVTSQTFLLLLAIPTALLMKDWFSVSRAAKSQMSS